MAIIGAKCLNRILKEMKQDCVDFDQLTSKELGRLFNSYLSAGGSRKTSGPDLQSQKRE